MPREKRFRAMSLQFPFNDVKIDAFDIAETCYAGIKNALEALNEDKVIHYEINLKGNELDVRMQKVGKNQFIHIVESKTTIHKQTEDMEDILRYLFRDIIYTGGLIGVDLANTDLLTYGEEYRTKER